jgi:hypothetical protein
LNVSAPLIDQLIDKTDTFELVRDEIAAILLAETTNQKALAVAAGKPAQDWALNIYTERSDPWNEYLDLPETVENPAPAPRIVNVWFNGLTFDMAGSNVVESQKATAIFHVDCYAYAASADAAIGHLPGDQAASLQVHRVVRLVRNILMAATYTYLGMRGIVGRRWITAIDAFQPSANDRLAQSIGAARISLQVEFNEFSPQVTGGKLELISVAVTRSEHTGQIYFTANYPH